MVTSKKYLRCGKTNGHYIEENGWEIKKMSKLIKMHYIYTSEHILRMDFGSKGEILVFRSVLYIHFWSQFWRKN